MRNLRLWLVGAAVALGITAVAGVMLLGGPSSEASDTTAATSARHDGRGGSVWGANYFPNVPLITHEGETVRFFDDMIKDKVVAINFIYTTCPDACPMETARLLEVQHLLGEERMGKDVFFYSITIDPEHDTPEVLAEFVENWKIGPGWKFLTGKEEDITLLRRKLGLYIEEIQGEDSNDHNLSLIIGNQATGRWMKRSPYENPHVLATQMGQWLHGWKIASKERRSYEDAPELRQISTGELLFRTRCASCHTIGKGDVQEIAERRVGPDLLHVVKQRDRAWLERWLKEPDAMLEEKDPLAMSLYEQYDNVPMPNLRLSDVDVRNLIEYMEEESDAVQKHIDMGHHPMPAKMAGHGDHGDHASHPQAAHQDHSVHGDHAGHGDHP